MIDTPKIIFWGTSDFAVPALEILVKNGYKIAGVVTTPDEPKGRKLLLTPPPVKVAAGKHGLEIFQPEVLNSKTELPEADLFIVAAYGKIIPKVILENPRLGALNIHPSLLPRWRGPSPIQYAVLSGDRETGVTIMKIDELMDHGPIIATSGKLQLTSKTTYKELHDKLAKIGAGLLVETLPKYLSGELKPIPQDDSKATFSKILTREDGRIDWSKSAEETQRMVQAFNPWPGVWTTWPSAKKIYRLKIDEAEVENKNADGQLGLVSAGLIVNTGKQGLKITKLTLEGKKTMGADEFLQGYKNIIGQTLI